MDLLRQSWISTDHSPLLRINFMIRLFRKIRQQLLAEDKYPVYLLYAGGEILLVVVGILIALQIDNWNDQRKEKITELNYLSAINYDLELNRLEVESFIRQKQSAIESANIILQYYESDTLNDPSYFNLHHLNVSIFTRFEEKNNTFRELENSGQPEGIAAAKAYPTNVRSTGIGWAIGLGRFGAVVGPAVAGYLIAAGLDMSANYFIFAVPMAIGGVIAYRLHIR